MKTSKAKDVVTRVITPHDLEVAKRLKAIYMRKRQALGLTQEKLTSITGYKQSTISSHMNGHTALRGLEGIVAYANALEVHPKEIDPKFTSSYASADIRKEIPIPVTNLVGDTKKRVAEIFRSDSMTMRGFVLSAEYEPIHPKNTLIIADRDKLIKKGALLMVQIRGKFALCRLHELNQRSVTYSLPWGYSICREQVIRNGKISRDDIDAFYSIDPIRVPLKELSYMAPVIAIELP